MKDKNFNRLTTDSENLIKEFAVLANGVIVEYHSRREIDTDVKQIEFTEGRIVTPAVPNGLAFDKFKCDTVQVIGIGTLLHKTEDVRDFEEQSALSDRI